MTDTTWHASSELIAGYVAGRVDGARAASLEAHVVVCRHCQQQVAEAAAMTERLDKLWARTTDVLDQPKLSLVERILLRVGVRESDARLVATTPALTTSWIVSVLAAMVFASLRSGVEGRAATFFLIVAPVLPLVAVAVAFSRRLDLNAEMTTATPMSGLHLVLVRGAAALVPAAAALSVAAALLPGMEGGAVAWLLPAIALCACSLAASTWMEPLTAASALAVLWVAGVITALLRSHDGFTSTAANGLLASGTAQTLFAAVAVAALAVAMARREAFEFGR